VEKEPLRYGYSTTTMANKKKQKQICVAPILFYVYGPKGFVTSIEVVQKEYHYSSKTNSCYIGWLVRKIFNEKWSVQYFKPNILYFTTLMSNLNCLQEKDVEKSVYIEKDKFLSKPLCPLYPIDALFEAKF